MSTSPVSPSALSPRVIPPVESYVSLDYESELKTWLQLVYYHATGASEDQNLLNQLAQTCYPYEQDLRPEVQEVITLVKSVSDQQFNPDLSAKAQAALNLVSS